MSYKFEVPEPGWYWFYYLNNVGDRHKGAPEILQYNKDNTVDLPLNDYAQDWDAKRFKIVGKVPNFEEAKPCSDKSPDELYGPNPGPRNPNW